MQESYSIEVKNRFEALSADQETTIWETFRDSLVESASTIIPKMARRSKNKWMTEEILDLMKERQTINDRDSQAYKDMNKAIKKKCIEAKDEWLNASCREIENLKNKSSKLMHKKIKELSTTNTTCSSGGCIKGKDGTILMEKEQIIERWTEYIQELFEDDRGDMPHIRKDIDGPEILKDEVRFAVKHMKRNKACGPDNIYAELLQASEEFSVEKITEIANDIYNSGKMPEDLSKSIFIALPKKPGATECELHRTISLMSVVLKVILRVLMQRMRNKIRPEIDKTQCGFMKDTGTRNAIFILRNVCERAIEVNKDLHLCFIDFNKAFDRVRHNRLLNMLQDLDLDGKDIRLVRNLYWNQSAAIRYQNELGNFTHIKRGVRQGCVLSPDLFNLYSENIMRHLEDVGGVIIGGYRLNNLRYADDIVLIAHSKEKLQEMLNIIDFYSEENGLSINLKKTEGMVVGKYNNGIDNGIVLNGNPIKQVEHFKYLGTWITSDGKCDKEIKSRIAMAKETFYKLTNIFHNHNIRLSTKLNVLNTYVHSILLYASECWTLSTAMIKKLEAAEMWFYRRILRISYTRHITNEEVLNRMATTRNLINTIRNRQMSFFGHVMRNKDIENLSISGKIEGKRCRGRQRITYAKSLSDWIGVDEATMMRTSLDRIYWATMTANARERHGT